VGLLLTSASYTHCLTVVDRFTSWSEVIPIPDTIADTVACTLPTDWISTFSCPQTIIQGHQFESLLFHSLGKLCGIQLSWTTAHHPAANRLMERFHRTLKADIMCHAEQHWTEALPQILLRIYMAFEEDLQASVAELVYGGLLALTADPLNPAHPITELSQHMAHLRPVPAACHASLATFVHSDL
jgi:cleavage and polyadenylation specificity factor subunit 1